MWQLLIFQDFDSYIFMASMWFQQASVPLATAAAWSNPGVNPANWAQEGAWGNNRGVAGFWEEPARPKPTKSGKVNK